MNHSRKVDSNVLIWSGHERVEFNRMSVGSARSGGCETQKEHCTLQNKDASSQTLAVLGSPPAQCAGAS